MSNKNPDKLDLAGFFLHDYLFSNQELNSSYFLSKAL